MAADSEDILLRIKQSLEGGPYECTTLEKLTGGTANFVYRGALTKPLDDGSKTVVVKHTESYVASHPNFKLASNRCDFEQTILCALQTLSATPHAGIKVRTPKMYSFSSETNTQIYSDFPASTELKTYASTHPLNEDQCTALGQALGKWTKTFHNWAAAPEQGELREAMKGNEAMKDLKYMINYPALTATIENFPEILENSREIFEAVAKDVNDNMAQEEGSLIHGDFWSGNILLKNEPLVTPGASDSTVIDVYVIDWELSHLSSIAFDLGQMFAELFELKHFKDIDAGVWLIKAFMQGYGKIDEHLAFKVAIHVGTHLIGFGTRVQGWGTKEQVEEVARIGNQFVVQGWQKEKKSLEGTVLGCLFTPV